MSDRTLFNLDGHTALVTGGSRGLGLQIAEALGEYGARVMISARKADELERAQAYLKDRGIDVEWMAADGSQPGAIRALAKDAVERLGGISILVNNAGTNWGAPAAEHPLEAWDKVFNLNVRGLFLLTQEVARLSMLPNHYGRIINVASIAGLVGNPPGPLHSIAYNTAKGAVVNFTRTLAGEWGPYGITVNALAPGYFRSKMTRAIIEQVGIEKLVGHTPLQRIGADGELKGAALLLASGASSYITGQILAVDGGYTAV